MQKINVIIPMAGEGSRFKKAGFKTPKPLIKVFNKTLIEISIESLNIKNANFYFVAKKYENKSFNNQLKKILLKYTDIKKIFYIKKKTSGAAETLLKVKNLSQNIPLLTANCDQYMNWNSDKFLKLMKKKNYDGGIVTYKSKNKKNSFAKVRNNIVLKITEKKVISNNALIGIHYWKKTSYFFSSAKKLIKKIKYQKLNTEPYVSETYNFLLDKKMKIASYLIKPKNFFLIGMPKDYNLFKTKFKNDKRNIV
jgi:NDP-sugar pyrophosphorylase family protein